MGRTQKEPKQRPSHSEGGAQSPAKLLDSAALAFCPYAGSPQVQRIQEIRSKYDRAAVRWPQPHVRLFWPFIPLQTVQERQGKLEAVLGSFPAFEFSFGNFEVLPGSAELRGDADRVYVGLLPSAKAATCCNELSQALLAAFPECRQQHTGTQRFHMTVGQFQRSEAEKLIEDWNAQGWQQLAWHCNTVSVLVRAGGDANFKEALVLQLGGEVAFEAHAGLGAPGKESDDSTAKKGLAETSRPSAMTLELEELPLVLWFHLLELLPLRDAVTLILALLGNAAFRDPVDTPLQGPELERIFVQNFGVALDINGRIEMTSQRLLAAAAASHRAVSKFCCLPARQNMGKPPLVSWCCGESSSSRLASMKDWESMRCGLGLNSAGVRLDSNRHPSILKHNHQKLLAINSTGLRLWDLSALKERPLSQQLQSPVTTADLHGSQLVTGGRDALLLYDLDDPRAKPSRIRLGKATVGQTHWMPDGEQALALDENGQKLWLVDATLGVASEVRCGLEGAGVIRSVLPLDESSAAVATEDAVVLWDRRSAKAGLQLQLPAPHAPGHLQWARPAGDWRQMPLAMALEGPSMWWLDMRASAALPLQLPQVHEAANYLERHRQGVVGMVVDTVCLTAWLPLVSGRSVTKSTVVASWHPMLAKPVAYSEWDFHVTKVAEVSSGAPLLKDSGGWDGAAVSLTWRENSSLKEELWATWSAASPEQAEARRKNRATLASKWGAAATTPHEKLSKAKLRPVEDVLHRLRYDETYSESKAVLGYEDRFLGPMEVSVADFFQCEVPLHRVWYIRAGNEVFWDRRRRFDRIFGSGDTWEIDAGRGGEEDKGSAAATSVAIQKAQQTAELIAAGVLKVRGLAGKARKTELANEVKEVRMAAYCFLRDDWREDEAAATRVLVAAPCQLRAVTFNVCCEIHGDTNLHAEDRTVAALQELRCMMPDLIALQEVTPAFANKVLEEIWVRESYWSSTGCDCASVTPLGIIVLSRFKIQSLRQLRLGSKRFALLAVLDLGADKQLKVAVLHLSSDRQGGKLVDATPQRRVQMEATEAALDGGEWLMLGDFNTNDSDTRGLPAALTCTASDVWWLLHWDEAGFTYDLNSNAVARCLSSQLEEPRPSRRLDRILLHSSYWTPEAIELAFTRPIPLPGEKHEGTWNVSDHFGLHCKLISQPKPTSALRRPEESLPSDLLAVLQGLLGGCEVWLLGSAALGTDSNTSDIDVLCCSWHGRAEFFVAAEEALRPAEGVSEVAVAAAVVPVLRLRARGRLVEVQYASLPGELRVRDLTATDLETLDEPSALGVRGLQDAEALLSQLLAAGGSRCVDAFRQLTMDVRSWAKERMLVGTAFGFLGGFAWAVLAAAEVLRTWPVSGARWSERTAAETLRSFFKRYAEWPWPRGVGLPGSTPPPEAQAGGRPAPMPIWCPTFPHANAARGVTAGTRSWLLKEFALAASGQDPPPVAFKRLLVAAAPAVCADVALHPLQGRALGFLLAVERMAKGCPEAAVRPLPEVRILSTRGCPCLVFGLAGAWTPSPGECHALAKAVGSQPGLEDSEMEVYVCDGPADAPWRSDASS